MSLSSRFNHSFLHIVTKLVFNFHFSKGNFVVTFTRIEDIVNVFRFLEPFLSKIIFQETRIRFWRSSFIQLINFNILNKWFSVSLRCQQPNIFILILIYWISYLAPNFCWSSLFNYLIIYFNRFFFLCGHLYGLFYPSPPDLGFLAILNFNGFTLRYGLLFFISHSWRQWEALCFYQSFGCHTSWVS